MPPKTLAELLDTWEPIEEEFPPVEELPFEPVEFDLDVDPATDADFRELMDFLSSGRKSVLKG